ncbi:16S rRNA (uracil(1498)-N(3))-methyltransferase [Patiriisocius marinus]|uniref:16S rRNA (uracil(1498)-N(3))-methyltransferase n=1 Tax=Patiriisocius marinus TaxID=1397112 RepID=UPI00232ADBEF|nr:16S rRNA (uracil(1498)-N(3))-methyltransferase [Patiriisocius marinus]
MQLFYSSNLNSSSTLYQFDKEESRHISKVLRKQIGDTLQLTDGVGNFYKATINSNDPKRTVVTIEEIVEIQPLPYFLHMAVAPTKLNDRFEWFLEKATEIGIHKITPIICDHSERKIIKPERYEKIIHSAAKQSLKAHFPILEPIRTFKEFITENHSETLKCIAHCEDDILRAPLSSLLEAKKSQLVMIGPEGDFSIPEIHLALENGFKSVSLGTSRLRTETAAIVACHSVSFIQ